MAVPIVGQCTDSKRQSKWWHILHTIFTNKRSAGEMYIQNWVGGHMIMMMAIDHSHHTDLCYMDLICL